MGLLGRCRQERGVRLPGSATGAPGQHALVPLDGFSDTVRTRWVVGVG